MNNSELEKKLNAARTPALEADYAEGFPAMVLGRLRSIPIISPVEYVWLPRLAWAGGLALACLMFAFAIGYWPGPAKKSDTDALLKNGKMLHEVLTLFPNRVQAITQDEHGVQLVLSDQADVPVSTPIYVHICDGGQCSSLVTFSGQELEIAGQKVTVLSDAQGGVIVAGARFAWSSDQPAGASGGLKIEAGRLKSINL